jgi:endonuclease YncB( thermonuclease family)/transcriptional regulator with XRE-family HTH domain
MTDNWWDNDPVAQQPPASQALAKLQAAGAIVTSGFRTADDVERLQREGYPAATNGAHNRGDGVDLVVGPKSQFKSLGDLEAAAREQFGPDAFVQIQEGNHVHVKVPGWGAAPDVYRHPQLKEGAWWGSDPVAQPPAADHPQQQGADLAATGQAHDGDTISLTNGKNARLLGYDAFELNQQGRNSSGQLVPLGRQARGYLLSQISPGESVNPTGSQSYGRPVSTLSDNPFDDPAYGGLRRGYGMAEPDYLKGSDRLIPYMDAERQARMNHLGGFQTNAETPEQFRHKDGPWLGRTPGVYGQPGSEAIFFDDPTPFAGLRPDIAKGYQEIAARAKTPDELLAYAAQHGFQINPDTAKKFIADRDAAHGQFDATITYLKPPPRPTIDPGDGVTGATLRGVGDPINVLDEFGAVADTLGIGGDGPRETIWNAPKGTRFGDIYNTNVDQNRAILDHDAEFHPVARTVGQLASGLAIPVGGIEGVGAKAIEEALASGSSRFAAEEAGKAAVARRLAALGTGEGAVAGAGAGEGGPLDRLPNAFEGAVVGGTLGLVAPEAINAGAKVVRSLRGTSAMPDEFAAEMAARNAAAASNPDVPPGGVPAPEGPRPYIDPAMLQTVNGGHAADAAPAPLDPQEAALNRQLYSDLTGKDYPGEGAPTTEELRSIVARRSSNGAAATSEETPNALTAALAQAGVEYAHPLYAEPIPVEAPADTLRSAAMAATPSPSISSSGSPDGTGGGSAAAGATIPEHIVVGGRNVSPDDLLPHPDNSVRTLEEAKKANPGSIEDLQAPDEFQQLGVRTVTTPNGGRVRVRGPLDITQSLRLMGGVKDQGGDLASLGIDNAPRRMPFGSNEQFLGKLVNNENGMSLDDAALQLWHEGYFPEFRNRPTPNDLIDKLRAESTGAQRYFVPHDLEEVANFHGAQADRGRIEQAQAEGVPLAERRGAPATLPDQIANTPPPTAYNEATARAMQAANVTLDKLASANGPRGADIRAAMKFTADTFGGFDQARRGIQGWSQTEELASKLGMTPETLLARAQGEAFNAEHIEGANRLLDASAARLVKARDAALNGGDAEKADFIRTFLLHSAIVEQASAVRAEAGRALNILRKVSKAGLADSQAIAAAVKRLDSGATVDELAGMVGDLAHDPAKLNTFVRDAIKPTWRDKIRALYYFSLLSNPVTHFVNTLGNMGRLGLAVAGDYSAVGVGAATAPIAKLAGKEVERFTLSEANARASALISEWPNALQTFVRTMRTGQSADGMTKEIGGVRQAFGGKFGTVISTPGRLLAAEDDFFKAFARKMALNGLAVREVRKQGLTGNAATQRIAELVASPTDEMFAKSQDYARYLTFQSDLGRLSKHIQSASSAGLWPFIPFVRTPMNIFKTAAEHSPLALAMPKWFWAEVRAGGAQRDAALGKALFGTALATYIAKAAADGNITGNGPADPNARRLLMQQGWQPYSFKVGDRYYSYSRIDPFATIIGTVADVVDKTNGRLTPTQRDQLPALVVGSIIHNLGSKTWLQGVTDLTTALDEMAKGQPGSGERYLQHFIAAWIPAPIGQTARAIDPVQRATSNDLLQGTIDTVKSRIPFASETLLPRRDMFGEPITRGTTGSGVGDFLNPVYTSKQKNDPVAQAIAASGATIGPLNRNVGGVKLNDKQYDQYQQLAGQLTRFYIQDVVSGPSFRAMSGEDRKAAINDAKDQAREDARVSLGLAPSD